MTLTVFKYGGTLWYYRQPPDQCGWCRVTEHPCSVDLMRAASLCYGIFYVPNLHPCKFIAQYN